MFPCNLSDLFSPRKLSLNYKLTMLGYEFLSYQLVCSINRMMFFLFCSRIWNETWLASFFYKPCNYELFVKQSLNMEMAIVMARVGSYIFIIHCGMCNTFHVLLVTDSANFRMMVWNGFCTLIPMN